MLDIIKKIFSHCETPLVDREALLQRASALLMLEIANADENYRAEERQSILSSLQTTYRLSEKEARVLLNVTEHEAKDILSLQKLTRLMVDELEMKDRVYVVELLWKVAFADQHLDHHEDYMVRKVADLLYVSHNDFIKAKLKIQKQVGAG